MAPRTKAVEGTSNEVKLAEAILNHKKRISELQHTNSALIERLNAMEAHVGTLTATSINAARNAGMAPRWYRPWMGGVAMGLVLVIMFAMTLSARRDAAKANAWIETEKVTHTSMATVNDSMVADWRASKNFVQVMPPRKSKRPPLTETDAVPAAVPSAAPAAVPASTLPAGGE